MVFLFIETLEASSLRTGTKNAAHGVGCQVVRHWIVVPIYVGSIPTLHPILENRKGRQR